MVVRQDIKDLLLALSSMCFIGFLDKWLVGVLLEGLMRLGCHCDCEGRMVFEVG